MKKLDARQVASMRPTHVAQYNHRMKRIEEHFKTGSPMMKIPAIATMEMTMALNAYYGGPWRALWIMFRSQFFLWRHSVYGKILISFSDLMGWTKLYDLPGSNPKMRFRMRHGRKCSGSPNCENMHCIEDSQPKWFRWVDERIFK